MQAANFHYASRHRGRLVGLHRRDGEGRFLRGRFCIPQSWAQQPENASRGQRVVEVRRTKYKTTLQRERGWRRKKGRNASRSHLIYARAHDRACALCLPQGALGNVVHAHYSSCPEPAETGCSQCRLSLRAILNYHGF